MFTVLVNPDRYPYSYMTPDGMPTGIMVDIFQKAAGRARLRYKFLKPADRSEYKAMLADGQADFVIDLTDDMSQAENYGYKLTDSYLSAEFSWVLLRRHNGGLNNVAVAYDFSPSALEMPGLSDTAHVEYLDSFDNCLAAVHAGTVDAYYTYTYQAERTVFDDTQMCIRDSFYAEREAQFRTAMADMGHQFWTSDGKLSMIGQGRNVVALIAIVFVVAILAAASRRLKARIAVIGVLSGICFLGYNLMLALSYGFIFVPFQAEQLIDYNRYIYSYYIGWFILALGLSLIHI